METYEQLVKEFENNPVGLLNAVAKEYQKAKANYNFGDITTWDKYVFWRSKYDIVHWEVVKLQK